MDHGLDKSVQNGLALYYFLIALMNVGFALYYLRGAKKPVLGLVWAAVAALFFIHSVAYVAKLGWTLPVGIREAVNEVTGPVTYTTVSVVGFVLLLVFRRFFVQPTVALAILNLSLLAAGWAMTDPNFQSIVTKEDNVPISMLIYSVGFFTWLGLYRGVQIAERMKRGEAVLG